MQLTTEQKRMLLQQSVIGYSNEEVEVNFHLMKTIFIQMENMPKEFKKHLDEIKTVEEKRNCIYKCFGAYDNDTIETTYETSKEELANEIGMSVDEFEVKAFEYFKYSFEIDQENFFKKNPSG